MLNNGGRDVAWPEPNHSQGGGVCPENKPSLGDADWATEATNFAVERGRVGCNEPAAKTIGLVGGRPGYGPSTPHPG